MNIDKILQDLELLKKAIPGKWVVKYNGACLTLASGKSIWKQKNHAASAWANHIEHIYSRTLDFKKEFGFKNSLELAHYLVEQKIVSIEQL